MDEQGSASPPSDGVELTPLPVVFTTDDVGDLMTALAKAQGAFAVPTRSKTADTGTYTYTYADLADIFGAVRSAFANFGIAVTQDVTTRPGNPPVVSVTTTLWHGDQRVVFGPLELPAGGTPQLIGSALTYARRYALAAAVGIAAEEDDDGARVSRPEPTKHKASPRKATEADMKRLHAIAATKGVTHEQMTDWCGRHLGIESMAELDKPGVATLEKELRSLPDVEVPQPAPTADEPPPPAPADDPSGATP